VIVHQDECGSAQLKRALDHFAGINRRVVHGAPLMHLFGNERILAVEKQDAELLGLGARHGGRAVIEKRLP
jgi:hypothetical protein